ncbi:ABC transporter substrate-binding protein [Pseudooceanicola sp. CBS1P-1]|uniref:ABC transporter substrate-binding protein n=1 Tax=Pseudooceanicola albus TaxID=2692189 RepID=A0A6L7G1S4_9RHOB|nr:MULTISPECIES: ABC transporter substrate-binding protein [Pseudooceanicola]MBT9383565.1 ABC transporter substrate-binding protein [Pseudooceanicola endophyticus]MXN17420.1 ABC transporter substrate-binding protein [Pseudooceanicola albus]
MTKTNISRRGFMASTAGLAASGLVLSAPSLSRAAGTTIRIGVGSDPVFSGFFVAQHEGYFKDEGVKVNLQTYSGGGEAMNALVAGQVDLASASESTTMVRMNRAEIRPLAVVYYSGLYVKLVLRPGIESPKDIKTFGVIPGSISDYCTGLTIAHFGLDAKSLKMVPSGPPELPALLMRGDIDAFFAWEPWPATAVAQGAKIALTSRDVGYTDTIWANASQAILESAPDELQAVLRAVARGSEVMENDPKRAAEAVKAVTHIPVDTTLTVSKDMTLTVRDFTDADFKSFDSIAQFLVDNKVTDALVPYRDYMQRGFYKG